MLGQFSFVAQVLIHPKSRLVAVGALVTFRCKIFDGTEAHSMGCELHSWTVPY